MSYINVAEDNFKSEVENFEGVVVIDFWAEWCNPCKQFSPIFEKISDNYDDKDEIKFVKINIDNAKSLAAEYEIMSIPTLMILENGEVIKKKIGLMKEKDLKELIDNIRE
ncbi:MAG TPA: thioredoxin [Candidatus Mcinerneyibacterium sp.]|nr:thioredoxin [Candidatus Mcinerneyibacterium sp.]